MRRLLTLLGLLSLMLQANAQPPSWPAAGNDARAGSRWWWMGSAVTADGLQQNISEYSRAGIGALEITPIYGVQGNESNELRYLSSGWMDALAAAQQAGEQAGVSIDMNGGTGWPFGGPWVKTAEAAGKLVTKTETLTADGTAAITMNVASPESNAPLNKVLAYKGDETVDVTEHVAGNTLTWTAPAGEWLIIAVYNGHTGQQVKRAAPGGEGPVLDHYDSTAVANYLKHFDEAFTQYGGRWPRSFFNDSYEVYGADWTPKMFDEFLKYRGYRLEEHMPELLRLKTDANNQVMSDYRQTLSDMLLNNFTRQWTAWAHSHGATTRNQGHGSPGNLIDFYAAVDIPEIEGFGLTDFKIRGLRQDPGFVRKNLSDFSTLKYASSAAHVTGKPLTSSETFTWLTEHFRTSLSQMKPDLDLMFVAGVNHVFFHGTTYTPPTAAWPGWKFYASIDMSPTNSIWHDAPELLTYIERCQSFLQMGRPDNDLLVYAPFLDAMHRTPSTRLQLFDINTLSQKMNELATCVSNIEAAGLDCDYISDELLMGVTYTDGMLQTAAGTRYKALVVPASKYMPAAVKAHLEALAAEGAVITWGNTAAQITDTHAAPEALRTELGLRVLRRSNATGHHYFITNLTKRDVEGYVPLTVAFRSAVVFNPVTGQMSDALVDDGQVFISLRSGESMILQTYDSAVSTGSTAPRTTDMGRRIISGPWTLHLGNPTSSVTPAERHAVDSLRGWQSLSQNAAQFMGTGYYETTFNVDARLMNEGDCGFRLNLGDVRESARVYVNGKYVGCAWCAPFTVDIPASLLNIGDNALRIEVTNLPANHIRQMDIDGVKWRIFKDVNILDISNGSEAVSGVTYNDWELMPSGLCSDVTLTPRRSLEQSLLLSLESFVESDGKYFPRYRLSLPTDGPVVAVEAKDAQGKTFSGIEFNAAEGIIDVRQQASGYVTLTATDAEGNQYETNIVANGAYEKVTDIDFTDEVGPQCGWTKSADAVMTGFSGTGKVTRYVAKKNGKVLTELYDGLTFSSEQANYFFYYPAYGLGLRYECELQMDCTAGTTACVTYVRGSSDDDAAYDAANAVTQFTVRPADSETLTVDLMPQTDYVLYRSLTVYKPMAVQDAIVTPRNGNSTQGQPTYYSLQGVPTTNPAKGVYISNGRKYVVR